MVVDRAAVGWGRSKVLSGSIDGRGIEGWKARSRFGF